MSRFIKEYTNIGNYRLCKDGNCGEFVRATDDFAVLKTQGKTYICGTFSLGGGHFAVFEVACIDKAKIKEDD